MKFAGECLRNDLTGRNTRLLIKQIKNIHVIIVVRNLKGQPIWNVIARFYILIQLMVDLSVHNADRGFLGKITCVGTRNVVVERKVVKFSPLGL